MNKVWEMSHLKQNETLVLLALADHANDKGITWAGCGTIAQKARMSTRTALRTISRLEEQKLLKVESYYRENKSQASNIYRLLLFEQCDILSHCLPEQCDKKGEQCDTAMSPLEPIEPITLKPLSTKKSSTVFSPPESDHKYFSAWWCYAFLKLTGEKYAYTKKQAGIIKNLLTNLDLETLMERACVWIATPEHLRFPRGSPTIEGLSHKINELAGKYNGEIEQSCDKIGILPDDQTPLRSFEPWQKTKT